MAQPGAFTPIIPYHSTTSGNVPTTGNMNIGEIAINAADRVIYTKDGTGAVVSIGNGATGGGGDTIFIENGQTVNNELHDSCWHQCDEHWADTPSIRRGGYDQLRFCLGCDIAWDCDSKLLR